jgi:MFS family permease
MYTRSQGRGTVKLLEGLTSPCMLTLRKELLRFCIYSLAVLHTFSVGGIIFGWSGLYLILFYSGVYAEDCSSDNPDCPLREFKLGSLFVIGSLGSKISILLFAPWTDRLGAKTISCLGNVLFLLGSGTLAFAQSTWPIDLFPMAVLVMTMGSGLSYFPLMHNAMLFKYVSISISGLSTSRDFSSVVYPMLFIVYWLFIPSRFLLFTLFNMWCAIIFALGWAMFYYKRFKRGQEPIWEPIPTSCFHHDSEDHTKDAITEDSGMESENNGEEDSEAMGIEPEQPDTESVVEADGMNVDTQRSEEDKGSRPTAAEPEREATETNTNHAERDTESVEDAKASEKEASDTDITPPEQEAEHVCDRNGGEESNADTKGAEDKECDSISGDNAPTARDRFMEWFHKTKRELLSFFSLRTILALGSTMVSAYVSYVLLGNLPVIFAPMMSLTGMKTDTVLVISSFLIPLGGVLGPVVGVIKQFLGLGSSFFTVSLLGAFACLLLLVPILEVQFLSAFVLGVFRVALTCVAFSYIADDVPEEYYGTYISSLMIVTMIASLLIYPTNFVSYVLLSGNMTVILLFLLMLEVLGFGVAFYFWGKQAVRGRRSDKGSTQDDQDEPEVNDDVQNGGVPSDCEESMVEIHAEEEEDLSIADTEAVLFKEKVEESLAA